MKLLFLSTLLLSSLALGVLADHEVQAVSVDRLGDLDFEYHPDIGAEDELFAGAMARLTAQDLELAIDDNAGEELIDDVAERTFSPHKKGRKKKRPNRRLKVQLKVFRRSRGGASYKYYILQGGNVRHYRVNFSRSQRFRFRKSAQRKTRRCLIRTYTKICLKLPFFIKGFCTTIIAKKCSGEFESFEIADPKTQGKNKVKPHKPHRPKRPSREPPVDDPDVNVASTPESVVGVDGR